MKFLLTAAILVSLLLPAVCQQRTTAEEDKSEAIKKMFKRKRSGGVLRAVICGAAGVTIILLGTTKNDPPAPIVTNSAPGSQLIYYPADNTGHSTKGLNAVGGLILVGFSISGIVQAKKYSETNLEILLREYRNGNEIPEKYQHLIDEDFN